jgi:hypothetical protein
MKQKTKILILLFSLILPYAALAAYMALTLRGNTVPMWFPYTALGYLVVSAFLFNFGRKRIVVSSPTPDTAEQKKQTYRGRKQYGALDTSG